MHTVIPPKLAELIANGHHAGPIDMACREILPLLGNSNTALYFFPEYTDHGPDHIANVLATAEKLIPDAAWRVLNHEDAVVLVMAVLLHDAAMALTPDGLLHLLEPNRQIIVPRLDSATWPVLFDEFFAEARRWDGQMLHRILGDKDNPMDSGVLMSEVTHIHDRPNPETWSVRYRKFLGEFVRRHHARLAHEIAHTGFPGGVSGAGPGLVGLPDDLRDISGLVARSHNMGLRGTYEYLRIRFSGRGICRSTHPPYLMVLLRIADYLQLDAKRVNGTWQSVQRLRSPISNAEWNAHLSIKEVREDDDDPESLFIVAEPESAATYVKIKRLVAGLQQELDTSWAVLSENYAAKPKLQDLGITIRRVRTNLDDERQYLANKSPDYFPIEARFDTAGASLLMLLIRPLYGDRPEVGVRELLQNALDAVHELRRLRELHPELRKIKTARQKADVLISIDENNDGHHYLTITDKGIGMTAETVCDYFLKAGASFRTSDAWKREFAPDGNSTVARSGRFGIGALAAFLLGDRISVETRHARSAPEDGVRFAAGIDDEFIELGRVRLETVGTQVTIRLTNSSSSTSLKNTDTVDLSDPQYEAIWDWYVFDDPLVERRIGKRKQRQWLTISGNPLHCNDNNGRIIHHPDYDAIHWNFSVKNQLICNGILIHDLNYDSNRDYTWGSNAEQTPLHIPVTCVFDSNSHLPLNIQRSHLESPHFPFEEQLASDMTKDFCAMMLHSPSTSIWEFTNGIPLSYHFGKDLTGLPDYDSRAFLFADGGTTLFHPWHMKNAGIQRVMWSTHDLLKFEAINGRPSSVAFGIESIEHWAWADPSLGELDNYLRRFGGTKRIWNGARITIVNELYIQENPRAQLQWEEYTQLVEDKIAGISFNSGEYGYGWTFEFGICPPRDALLNSIVSEWEKLYTWPPERRAGAIIELFIDPDEVIVADSPFNRVWNEVMQHPVIPYDMKERKQKFAHAYEELKDYFEAWRNPVPGGWREALLKKR